LGGLIFLCCKTDISPSIML